MSHVSTAWATWLPWATERTTVLGPVTASPAAKTPGTSISAALPTCEGAPLVQAKALILDPGGHLADGRDNEVAGDLELGAGDGHGRAPAGLVDLAQALA